MITTIDFTSPSAFTPEVISALSTFMSLPSSLSEFMRIKPRHLGKTEHLIIARCSDGTIAGFVEIKLASDPDGIITGLIPQLQVRNQFKGDEKKQGIQSDDLREQIVTELLSRSIKWLKANGAHRVELGLWSNRLFAEFRDRIITMTRPDIH